MFNFPSSTEFNKRIPKQKFYENTTVTPALKKIFVEQIQSIYWKNKIAASTTTLSEGTATKEIEIFEIEVSTEAFDSAPLRQIDKSIPYHIIFILKFENRYQIWTAYKEISDNGSANVSTYYHTSWLSENDIELKIIGLDTDKVYENFVRQIAQASAEREEKSFEFSDDLSLKENIETNERKAKLEKEIARLEKQARAEKQPRRKFEIVQQINNLRKELEGLL